MELILFTCCLSLKKSVRAEGWVAWLSDQYVATFYSDVILKKRFMCRVVDPNILLIWNIKHAEHRYKPKQTHE